LLKSCQNFGKVALKFEKVANNCQYISWMFIQKNTKNGAGTIYCTK
jgi:hypothetical protein